MADDKKSIMTPKGRLVNNALWVKESYTDERGVEGKPRYKIEMAFDWDDVSEIIEHEYDLAEDMWGDDFDDIEEAFKKKQIKSCFRDGDEIAKDRQKKGKPFDAYEGKAILRASTDFNWEGDNGPGGIYVADEYGERIDFTNHSKVYNGSYGYALIKLTPYKVVDNRYIAAYVNGYQFAEDGDRFSQPAAASAFGALSKPKDETKGRRRRRKD